MPVRELRDFGCFSEPFLRLCFLYSTERFTEPADEDELRLELDDERLRLRFFSSLLLFLRFGDLDEPLELEELEESLSTELDRRLLLPRESECLSQCSSRPSEFLHSSLSWSCQSVLAPCRWLDMSSVSFSMFFSKASILFDISDEG